MAVPVNVRLWVSSINRNVWPLSRKRMDCPSRGQPVGHCLEGVIRLAWNCSFTVPPAQNTACHSTVLADKGTWTRELPKSLLLFSLHLRCSLSPRSSLPSSCMCFRWDDGLMVHNASMLLCVGVGFRTTCCHFLGSMLITSILLTGPSQLWTT